MLVKLVKNEIIDDLFGIFAGAEIPTKQDKFKPLICEKAIIHKSDGTTEEFKGELYAKNNKASADSKKFEEELKEHIREQLNDEHPYKKGIHLEVIVSISMSEKRLKSVDIDNLLKYVLDCMNGLVYEDDSQILNVIASKKIIYDDLIPQINGIQIGIRRLDNKESLLKGLSLYHFEEVKEENNENSDEN